MSREHSHVKACLNELENLCPTRRDFLRLAGWALGAFGLTQLADWDNLVAAAEQKELVIMTSGGSWKASHDRLLVKPFESKYGVRGIFNIRSNAERIPLLVATKNRPEVDVVEPGDILSAKGKPLGLFVPLTQDMIPSLKNVDPRFRREPVHAINLYGSFVLTYNTKYVSKSDVASMGWEVLKHSKYRGRVAIPNYGWYGETWLQGANKAFGGTPDQMDPVLRLARAVMKENAGKLMNSVDHGMQMFTAEEIWIAPFWNGRTWQLADKGIPLVYEFAPGWVPSSFGWSIVARAPHMELALKFVDSIFAPEALIEYAREYYYTPTLTTITLPQDIKDRAGTPASALDKAAFLNWDEVIRHSDKNLEKWNKQVIG